MLTKPCILHKCKIAFSFLQNSFAKICNSFREKEKHLAFAKCLLLVGMSGLEPPTPTLSGWCSNLLSYIPLFSCEHQSFYAWWGSPTLCSPLALRTLRPGWCSNLLSYIPLFVVNTKVFMLGGGRPPYVLRLRYERFAQGVAQNAEMHSIIQNALL